jgi:hypothetical protein
MTMMTAEELLERLQGVLKDVQLTPMALRGIVMKYADKASLPSEQNTASMNGVLRDVGMDFSRPLRAELVICQVFLLTHGHPLFVRTLEDLTKSFDFETELVCADPNLALFASYMDYALMLVRAKGHMDFIINDVVAPLSENLSGRRFASGGGSETISTMMRYKIFECLSGQPRPKNVPMGAASLYREPNTEAQPSGPHKIANLRSASATDISVTSNEDDYPLLPYSAVVVAAEAAQTYPITGDARCSQQFLFDSLPLQQDILPHLDGSMALPWDILDDALLADAVEQDAALSAALSAHEGSLLDDGNDPVTGDKNLPN